MAIRALLIDDDAGEVGSLNVIIRPDGWSISEEVNAIHGISTEKAISFGIPIHVAMAVLASWPTTPSRWWPTTSRST